MDLEIESGRVDLPPYGFAVRTFFSCDVKMTIFGLDALRSVLGVKVAA